VAVAQNTAAFRFGRQWALDPGVVAAAAGISAAPAETLDELLDRLTADLADYQDRAYARRFRSRIDRVRAAGSDELTATAARSLHKLMAYKDEYEVARLALLPESQARYRAVGGPDTQVTYHLHPPALKAIGVDRKIKFRRLGKPSFLTLRAMKRLRGTWADPFAHAVVRRLERDMIPEFESAIDSLLAGLGPANLAEAIAIAELPDQVRGYEELKLRRAAAYRAELTERLAAF
jgi:indolepyruvate ferredoxin oxidoreductase